MVYIYYTCCYKYKKKLEKVKFKDKIEKNCWKYVKRPVKDSIFKAHNNIVELEKIRKNVLSGEDIEEVLENFDWKEFEKIVSDIFEINSFRIFRNFRFKTNRRYEIDLIAIKGNKIICVDCKEWGRGRYKKSGLKNAADKQKQRVKEFRKFLRKNPIAKAKFRINKKNQFHPLIITLFQEEIIKKDEVFIVPIWKLNHFLNEMEKYL